MPAKLDFEQTLMYGQYKEDLAGFARSVRRRANRRGEQQRGRMRRRAGGWLAGLLHRTIARVGEDWPFLALLGITMAIISFTIDFFIQQCHTTRMLLYGQVLAKNLATRYLGWVALPVLLLLFASSFVHIVAPQAIGSGIPEMKTVLRGVLLHEYLSGRTLLAKLVGLACSLGSGLPLGKEGPFVHVASMVATILRRLVPGSFQAAAHDRDARTTEMLAAACAVGVATTFYSPIGGVLFSVEVTTDFFAVRNYWRGFFAACCAAAVWRLLAVWFKKEAALTSLFKTSFRTDFPFDPQELVVFALIGVLSGLLGAAYVRCHRRFVLYIRNQRRLSQFLKQNRLLYPGLMTLLLMSVSFPPFMGRYMASTLSNAQTFQELFSNITWGSSSPGNDSSRLTMLQHWSTEHSSIYANLVICIVNTFWMSILASTIPVPSGLFVPIFKIGAALGRLVGELMAACFPGGIPFSGYTIPIVPGGYSVVGAAAFTGAVTHTISITVIVFEMTGQMSHMIPVILAVLISNAISQRLELCIYDSVIQIKKLPFLPPIMTAPSIAHNVFVDDIMVRDLVYVWSKRCTYRDLQALLDRHPGIQTFPLVDTGANMILLGSIQRQELLRVVRGRLSRDRRRQHWHQAPGADANNNTADVNNSTSKSRFEVSPVIPSDGQRQLKSILKQTITFTSYSPYATVNTNPGTISKDSRLRQVFEDIFQKSMKLPDANPDRGRQPSAAATVLQRRVQLPRARVIDLPAEEQKAWEEEELSTFVDFNDFAIDPAPFQLVERTTIYQVHLLFSMLALPRAYVTSTGRLVGVVALKDLRVGIERMNQGLLQPHSDASDLVSYLDTIQLGERAEPTDVQT